MNQDESLIGDSSTHSASETSPSGGFYRHRLTIRFTSGETLLYTVRDALHAEDISSTVRFVVITSFECELPEKCSEIVLLNLNKIAYIKTEHVTEVELTREALIQSEEEARNTTVSSSQLISHIGFI